MSGGEALNPELKKWKMSKCWNEAEEKKLHAHQIQNHEKSYSKLFLVQTECVSREENY